MGTSSSTQGIVRMQRDAENIFWLEVREVNTLQGYNPRKKSFSQPPKIVKGVQRVLVSHRRS